MLPCQASVPDVFRERWHGLAFLGCPRPRPVAQKCISGRRDRPHRRPRVRHPPQPAHGLPAGCLRPSAMWRSHGLQTASPAAAVGTPDGTVTACRPPRAATHWQRARSAPRIDTPAGARLACGRHAAPSIGHGHETHSAMHRSEAARTYQSAHGHKQRLDTGSGKDGWNVTWWRGGGWRMACRTRRFGSVEGTAAPGAHTLSTRMAH